MKKIATILFSLIITVSIWDAAEGQVIVEQDFDSSTSWGYTTSIPTFDDGWGTAYFGVIDVNSASPLNKAEFTSNIFGENDLNSTNGTSGFATITFDPVSITSYSNVQISFDYQVVGYNVNGDDFRYEVFHDGVGQGQIDLHDGGSDPDDSEDTIIISVPNSVDEIYLVLSIRNDGKSGYSGFDNFQIAESSIQPEPSNHATSFSATSSSISGIDLSWTDAAGSTTPENYLILINESGSFTAPIDGTPQPDDTDFSDGTGILNVAYGVESATFSGLSSDTQYYFEIYPYTNLGSNIDYKTDGTIPSANVSTLEKPDLVLNEILADPDSDANGDGNFDSSDDEFLEFVNTSSNNLDISDWTISDAVGIRHTFSDEPATILAPNQAVVVFGGGDPTGPFGGSILQTSGNLGLNNSNESITVRDESDNILIEITFSGANNQSETRNPDLTGSFEDHTSADSHDNSAFSPGTRIDGSPFQSSETLSVTFDNGEGWRMVSAPTSGNTYHNLLQNLWTQGTSGADYPGGDPNVMTFDGSAFASVSDLSSDIMLNAQGFIVYVYSDDDYDQTAQDNGFPKTLNFSGVPRTGYVEASLNSGNDSWTLTGNPYKQSIDWDNLGKTDLYGTVYVYDPTYGTIPNNSGDDVAESGTGGGYRTWNGSSGSLSGGVIAPFQGFWVQSIDSSPELIFQEEDQTTGSTFYTKEDGNVISMRIKGEMKNMYSEAFLSFTEFGDVAEDRFDGLKLSPLDHRNYMSLSTEVDGIQMDINNLPIEFYDPIEIPLHVQSFEAMESGWTQMGGEVTLSWPEMKNIPTEWEITLTDTKLNRTVNLWKSENYAFEAETSLAKLNGKKPFTPFDLVPLKKEKAINEARFLITIDPNMPSGLIDNDIPDQFTLGQNYPNPFNPTTNIKFEIAETRHVTLSVFNVMGQRVATLVNESKAPGTYKISWDAQEMASGIYYYRLTTGGITFNRQMTLIK